jgi:PTS system nitrogen regulatory IIA component
MSDLKRLLSPENVLVNVQANCKREALQKLAQLGADASGISADDILTTLAEREKLGSTGIGGGIAIPHGKLSGIECMVAVLVQLDHAIDFEAVDDEDVDLLFLLLAPENANALHLKTLSKVARLMRSEEVRHAMRGANSAEALYAIAVEDEKPHAA